MVALVFLTLGMLPIFSVITSSLNLASRIENNLVAANLAQEGVEVVRAIRDANWMAGNAFNQNLSNGSYTASWDSLTLTPWSTGQDSNLKLSSTNVYSHTTGSRTIFSRIIRITNFSNWIQVRVDVAWNERGQSKAESVQSYLFNWK